MDERRERDPDTGEHIYVGTGISDIFAKTAKKLRQKQLKKEWKKLEKRLGS